MPLSYPHAPLEKALANERGGGAEIFQYFFRTTPETARHAQELRSLLEAGEAIFVVAAGAWSNSA
jgi:hypothetical protein